MFRVIIDVINTSVDNYICLGYLVMIQDKLSKHDNKFEKTKFKYFLGW